MGGNSHRKGPCHAGVCGDTGLSGQHDLASRSPGEWTPPSTRRSCPRTASSALLRDIYGAALRLGFSLIFFFLRRVRELGS